MSYILLLKSKLSFSIPEQYVASCWKLKAGCWLTVLLSSFALAGGPNNLALNKKLEYSPRPEYVSTVHPNDPFKLTDGVKGSCLWYPNYREKTVGWGGAKWVEITLDLGQIQNIGSIHLYTVGGIKPDVDYPEYAIIAASLDGKQYAFSNFTTSEEWKSGVNSTGPKTMVLKIEQKARFIKLFIRPTGYYFFTDEIEVIESQFPELEGPSDFLSKDKMISLVDRARQLQREWRLLNDYLHRCPEVKKVFSADIDEIEIAIAGLIKEINNEKLSKMESDLAGFRARLLRSQYNADWICYPVDPMDILRYGDLPTNVFGKVEISLYQWQSEYSVAVINLVNCSNSEIIFKASFSPLHFLGQNIDTASIFELRRAVYVCVKNAGLVADPLVLQNAKPFPVATGQTVQLWVEAYADGLKPGEYTGALAIDALDSNLAKTQQIVPIKLQIANKTFPNKIPFLFCNWDYVTISDRFTSKSPELVKQAIADLEKHYINVSVIRLDKVFEDKKGLSPQKLCNELVLRSKQGSVLLLGLNGRDYLERCFGTFRTSAWQTQFLFFLARFRDFMLNNGFDYNSFAIYPLDEDIGEDFVYVAQVIKTFDPRLKIYANKWVESDSQFRKVSSLIDIWCPHLPEVLANKNTFDRYKKTGDFDQIWTYYANIGKNYFFSPAKTVISKLWRNGPNGTAFRTMPIVAASLDMGGAGFWVYQDADKAGWTEDTLGEHGVVYNGAKNPDKDCISELIVPSKRWRQWRQGVEDAICLRGHKDLLDEFFKRSNAELTEDYLTSLRKRADEKGISP